jgi:hypothetical protein
MDGTVLAGLEAPASLHANLFLDILSPSNKPFSSPGRPIANYVRLYYFSCRSGIEP